MPIYADWRHPNVSLAQGGEPMEGGVIFCSFDETIEKNLQALHHRQRLCGDVQHEIDTYLVACIAPHTARLKLPRHSVPHYDTLPDISAYAIGILDPAMDSDPELQQVLLLLRQCTPLRRRTKRAQREVQWREDSCFPMQTLVRCMQGTLLGLYPNCVKSIAFAARITLYRFLRTLLVQPFARLHAALNKIPYITKLSVMEHLCNTIYDYHPGICHTLNRSGQKMEHFCDSVSNICSIFRTELNTLFCAEISSQGVPTALDLEQILFRVLPKLERTSHSFYERSTRAYRGIIIGSVHVVRSLDIARRLVPTLPKGMTLVSLLDCVYATGNQGLFDTVHASSLDANTRELAWHLTQMIQARPLPACVAARQSAALMRRYGDTGRTRQCRMLHLCVQCVIRRGTATGIRLRHDCITNELACMTCGAGTVLAIDMVGRLVHIAGEHLLLSSCCGTFIFYHGTGFEFVTACGPQCVPQHQLFRKRDRTMAASSPSVVATPASSSACLICGVRASIAQSFSLLEPRRREMVSCVTCAKHMVPAHILKHAYTRDDVFRFFALRSKTTRGTRLPCE